MSVTSSSTWDLVSAAYTEHVAPLFHAFAEEALDAAGVDAAAPAAQRIVDVACGPGTVALEAAARGARVDALDFSPEMIALLHARNDANVTAVVGDGQALPYPDRTFDAAVSLFGLMFFPDRAQGFRELRRVLVPGGVAVVTSWVPVDRVALLKDAIEALCVAAGQPPPALGQANLGDAADFRREMEGAGFVDVSVNEHTVLAPFASSTELITWMAHSTAPIVLMKRAMGPSFDEVFQRWDAALREKHSGRVELPLVANLGRGVAPR